MPTYEYACKDCGSHLEVVQSFTDDALTECPSCNGRLRKVFGAIGIAFKGSGFYKNDSRSSTSTSKKSSDQGNASTGESQSGSSGSESKGDTPRGDSAPASKSETKTKTKTNADSNRAAS